MSKVKRAAENLKQAVKEETGQKAKVMISLYDHSSETSYEQFGGANKIANQLAETFGEKSKRIWSYNGTYGIKFSSDDVDVSVFFNGKKSLQEVENV